MDGNDSEVIAVVIKKTPHLLFYLFLCFSVLSSKKAEKVKKKYKKSRLPNVQKWIQRDQNFHK